MKKHKVLISCFLILSLSIFLRFYKAPELFVMTTDEAYGIALAQTIVNDFHVIWVGENASNTGFYMGPFWAYFTAFWLYISSSNHIFLSYLAASIGVLTTVAIFITGKKLFNLKVAFIAGLLYATLPLIVFFDQRYWIVTPVPLLSVLLVFALCMTRVSLRWWIAVGILYGLVFHSHLSLAPLGAVVLYLFHQQRKKFLENKKVAILALLAFFLTISPLVIFDYFHKGSNILTPFRIASSVGKNQDTIDPLEHAQNIFRAFGRLWYLYPGRPVSDEVLYACSAYYNVGSTNIPGVTTQRSTPILGLSLFSLAVMVWFFLSRKTWKNFNTRIVALALLSILVGFTFFPMVSLDYYLLGAFPLFLFIPALLTTSPRFFVRICFLGMVTILSFLGMYTIMKSSGEYGLITKINLVKKISNVVGNDTFEVLEEGNCQTNAGWRSIFKKFGATPGRAPADLSVGYLYPEEISKTPLRYRVTIFETRIIPRKRQLDQNILEEGGFWALVSKNW